MPEILTLPTIADPFSGLPECFREFADPHFNRPKCDARTPCLRDGHIYATDGRWMVRVAASDFPASLAIKRGNFPDAPGLFRGFAESPYQAEPVALPESGETMPCPTCREDPEWTAGAYCEDCDNQGTLHDTTVVTIAPNVHLQSHRVAVLRRLGASVYLPRDTRDVATPVRFTIGAVEGYVMRCKCSQAECDRRLRDESDE